MSEKIEENYKIILYCDGGARPTNPGPFGWGAHGFIYNDNERGKTVNRPTGYHVTNQGYLEESTVDAILNNTDNKNTPIPAHLSKQEELYKVNPLEYFDWHGSGGKLGSNNEAEILAYLNSLINILRREDLSFIKEITFYTDSSYLLGILRNLNENPNWSEKDVANRSYWIELEKVLNEYKKLNINIVNKKIEAHIGHLGNELADKLATLGTIESNENENPTFNFNVYPNKKYWKPDVARHPFLTAKQVFFLPVDSNTKNQYITIAYKDEITVGKQVNMANYSLVTLNEKDSLIESVKNKLSEKLNGHNVVSTVRLDTLYKPANYNYLTRYGVKVITEMKTKINALDILYQTRSTDSQDRAEPLANELRPAGLAWRALENVNFLRFLEDNFRNNFLNGKETSNVHFIDITETLFEIKEDKHVLLKEVKNNKFKLKEKFEDKASKKKYTINLQMDTDLLNRNALNKLGKQKPRIYLAIKVTGDIKIEFGTIVRLDNDETITTTNFYSNTLYAI